MPRGLGKLHPNPCGGTNGKVRLKWWLWLSFILVTVDCSSLAIEALKIGQ